MATLTVSVVLLFIISLAALFANRSQVFDLRVAANHYRYTQAYEMAEKGLELSVAWLQSRAAIPDDQNISRLPGQAVTCLANQVIPIRYATWGCDSGQTAAQCQADPYEYLQSPASCNPAYPPSVAADQQPGSAAFEVAVKVRRLKGVVSERYRFDIIAEAKSPSFSSSSDIQKARVSVRQSVAVHPMPGRIIPPNPGVPILVRDVVSVRTKPKTCSPACVGSNGYAVATLQENLSNFDVKTLQLFNASTPVVNILQLGPTTVTVFDILFRGVSPCDMLDISETQRTNPPAGGANVFFFGSCDGRMGYSLPSNNNLIDVTGTGSTTRPIFVIVSPTDTYNSAKQCPSINTGGGTLYGIFYFGRDCDANGFGSTKVEGTIAVEGSLLNVNATATYGYNPLTHTTSDYDVITGVGNLPQGRLARIPGSWRDY